MTAPQETLELTADVAGQSLGAAPCSAICGNCKHYEPYRDSQTRRVHPSGEPCRASITIPKHVFRQMLEWYEAEQPNEKLTHSDPP